MRIFQPIISGSIDVSGSLTVNNGITGSLFGTASYALEALTSSYAQTASYVNTLNQDVYITGSLVISGSGTTIQIYSDKLVVNAVGGDEGGEILLGKPVTNSALTGSGITIDAYQNKIRFFEQGGGARGAYIDLTACAGGAGTNLLSGGSGTTFNGGTNVDNRLVTATGTTPELNGESNLTFDGTTLTVTGNVSATSLTGSLFGTASYAITASYISPTFISASAAASGFGSGGGSSISASYALTASYVVSSISASYATTASYYGGSVTSASYAATASYVLQSVSSSFAATASYVVSSISASLAQTASYVNPLNQNVIITGSLTISGSVTGSVFSVSASYIDFDFDSFLFSGSIVFQGSFDSTQALATFTTSSISLANITTASISFATITSSNITGSLFGTASWASRAVTSSFATTASYILLATSASFATTASSVNPLTQNVIVNGAVTASFMLISGSGGNINRLLVMGSGSNIPIFTVQGSQGELFSITDSLSGSLFSVNDISGLPILEVFSDNTTLIGNYLDPMLITTAKVTQTNSGSFVLYSLPTSSYDTAFFEYSVKSGSNARAGTIMAIQSGASVNFTETTTTDIGSTSAVTFAVVVTGSNFALTGSSSTGAWTIKSIIRGI
jgi:hypothetical protein